MENVNQIIYTRKECGDELWNCVGEQLRLLCKMRYIATVYDDDNDIIVIQYSHQDEEYGTPLPEWLTPEEREIIYDIRANQKQSELEE